MVVVGVGAGVAALDARMSTLAPGSCMLLVRGISAAPWWWVWMWVWGWAWECLLGPLVPFLFSVEGCGAPRNPGCSFLTCPYTIEYAVFTWGMKVGWLVR